MKKSTIVKLICLAMLCLIMVPFIASCGNKITVYFDAGEGTVDETERKVKQNELIGRLPTPKREGYKFDGWYEEDDMDYQDQIKKTTPVSFPMVLVAKWVKDNTKAQIFFNAGKWGSVSTETLFIDKGTSLGMKLVEPTLNDDNAVFEGWFLDGKKVSQTTVFDKDVVLEAKYLEPVICEISGTYNHDWTQFDYEESKATCTTDGKATRYCKDCGFKQELIGDPKLGHDYEGVLWESDPTNLLRQTRSCKRCKTPAYITYINVSDKIVSTKLDGRVSGADNVGCLYDGNLTDTFGKTFCGQGSGPLTITVSFTEATQVDCVFVKGEGSLTYRLKVKVAGESDYKIITNNGAFGSEPKKFEIGATITEAIFETDNAGDGMCFWQEFAFAQTGAVIED